MAYGMFSPFPILLVETPILFFGMRKFGSLSLDITQIFQRSLTIIQPSLPCPGLFTRLLALPDVYYFTQATYTPQVKVSFCVQIEGLDTADLNIKIQGRGTKTTTFVCDIFHTVWYSVHSL